MCRYERGFIRNALPNPSLKPTDYRAANQTLWLAR